MMLQPHLIRLAVREPLRSWGRSFFSASASTTVVGRIVSTTSRGLPESLSGSAPPRESCWSTISRHHSSASTRRETPYRCRCSYSKSKRTVR
jgi:hypothetical protein